MAGKKQKPGEKLRKKICVFISPESAKILDRLKTSDTSKGQLIDKGLELLEREQYKNY